MRLKISLFLILAAVLAFGAGLVSFIYLGEVDKELRSTRAALASYGDIESVPVLKRSVKASEAIFPEDFMRLPIPRSFLPANAVRVEPVVLEGDVLIALSDIAEEQLLLTSHLAKRAMGEMTPTPLRLVNGKAAGKFTIANLLDFVPGLAIGAEVDVFLYERAQGNASVRLVASGLEVLKLPPERDGNTPQPVIAAASPALLLTGSPMEIAQVLLAEKVGELHMTLSSGPRAADAGVVLVGASELAQLPIAMRAVAGASNAPVLAVPAGVQAPVQILPKENVSQLPFVQPSGCTTTVVRASQRVKIEVPC